jgi:hypothetical protein
LRNLHNNKLQNFVFFWYCLQLLESLSNG